MPEHKPESRPRRSLNNASPSRLRFARNLRLARLAAGLTQSDVERRTGVPRTSLSDIEHGKQNATLDLMDRLATAVGRPLYELLMPQDAGIDARARKAMSKMTPNRPTSATFARHFRKAREAAGLSQNDVASRTGIHRSMLFNIEHGKQNITFETADRLADAISAKLTDLLQA